MVEKTECTVARSGSGVKQGCCQRCQPLGDDRRCRVTGGTRARGRGSRRDTRSSRSPRPRSSKRAVSRPAQGVKLTRRTCKSCCLSCFSVRSRTHLAEKRVQLRSCPASPRSPPLGTRVAYQGDSAYDCPTSGCMRSRGYTGWPAPPSPVFPPRGVRGAAGWCPLAGERVAHEAPPPLRGWRGAAEPSASASETGSTKGESEMKGLLAVLATIA